MRSEDEMNFNIVVLSGRLAVEPEIEVFESGSVVVKLLVTVHTEEPRRRIDVLPIAWYNPDMDVVDDLERGSHVWVSGAVQRRFWSADARRQSRVEIVAGDVQLNRKDVSELAEAITKGEG